MLNAIRQIALVTNDLDAATAFYRDVLGLNHLFSAPNMAFFDCGGVRLMLSLPSAPAFDHPNSILYFDVDDIHEAVATLEDRGVSFDDKPHLVAKMQDYDLWLTFFRDTEDNLLALSCNVPHD